MTKLIEQIEQGLATLDAHDLRRRRRVTSTPTGAIVTVDHRRMLTFCGFDYLGLAAHPKIQAALKQGVELYGLGSGASHLVSGHFLAHEQLEARLADMQAPYLERARAVYFGTGYMANLAVLSSLAMVSGPQDTDIFSEKLNHASLIDGAKLARCKVSIYPHRNIATLEMLLKNSSAATKIVATDGVFSMDGVIAPLPEILALCERYDAWLVVDDAHGFGVLGDGAGILAHFNLRSKNLIYMGTLGKAAAVSGAFVAAHESIAQWLIQKARPYIYTTAPPPAIAHALLASLEIICSDEGAQRRVHLRELVAQFKTQFNALATDLGGMSLMDSDTQIQPIIVGKNAAAMKLAAQLYEAGIWVPAIRPPTVPDNTARLRVSLSAAHTSEHVSQLLDALQHVQRKTA